MLFVISNKTGLGPSGSLTLWNHLLPYFTGIMCVRMHVCVRALGCAGAQGAREVSECRRAGVTWGCEYLIWILGT